MAGALPWRLFRDTFALGTSDIFGAGFMRRLARWLRVAVLDPDANLVPAMRAGAFGLSQGHILFSIPRASAPTTATREYSARAPRFSRSTRKPRLFRSRSRASTKPGRATKSFPKFTDLQLVFGKPIQPPPLNEASEAAYERLTSELKSRVVAMWQELREKELREKELPGKHARGPESDSKSPALAETH